MPDADLGRLQVRFDADITRLEQKLNQALQRTSRTARQMQDTVGRINLDSAIGSAFSSARNRVMADATRNVGMFGTALAALGPAGLAAGAAIAAFASATTLALDTARWAEALGDTANQLSLTTTQVQQLQFAATAAGIPVEQMTTSLVSLNQALGAAMGNDRTSARFQRAFGELGIDQATLSQVRDVSELLPLLADGFQRLNQASPARAAALGARLGIDPEVLHELEQGKAHIADLTHELERYGGVVSEEGVQRSAELADQMRILHGVADGLGHRLGSALAPAFVSVANSALQAVDAVIRLIEWLGHFDARSSQAQAAFNQAVAARARVAAFETGTYGQAVAAGMPGIGGAAVRANAARAAREDAVRAVVRGALVQIDGITAAGSVTPPTIIKRPTLTVRPSGSPSSRRTAGAASTTNDGSNAVDTGGLTRPHVQAAAEANLMDGRDMRGFALPVDQNVELITPDTYLAPLREAEDQMRETYHNVIQGGLEAAIHGGWPGLARFMMEQLQSRLLDTLADTLATVFQNAMQGNNSGNGIAGWISAGINALSGGGAPVKGFASGTPGGMAIVGEFGKELAFLPKGTEIANASATRALSMSGRARGGGPTFFIDARGSIGPDEIFAAINATGVQARQFSVNAAMGAFSAARAQIPQDLSMRARRRLG